MKLTSIFLASLIFAGCSVYTSKGREFLEREGLTFYTTICENNPDSCRSFTYTCSTEAPTDAWTPLEEHEGAQLSTRESASFDLLVSTDGGLNCVFPFNSAQELYKNSERAAEACLHLSPAACHSGFDFQ